MHHDISYVLIIIVYVVSLFSSSIQVHYSHPFLSVRKNMPACTSHKFSKLWKILVCDNVSNEWKLAVSIMKFTHEIWAKIKHIIASLWKKTSIIYSLIKQKNTSQTHFHPSFLQFASHDLIYEWKISFTAEKNTIKFIRQLHLIFTAFIHCWIRIMIMESTNLYNLFFAHRSRYI